MGILIVLILLALFLVIYFDNTKSVLSLDGRKYPVLQKYKDQQAAANTIGAINLFVLTMIKEMNFIYSNPKLGQLEWAKGKEVVGILTKRFSSDSLSENEPQSSDKTSYTKNKGEIISLCLREKDNGTNNIHSLEVLKYVTLHELAHIITPEYDHTYLFWVNFRFLLEFCDHYGLYHSPDFAQNNTRYCSLDITYNPLYDPAIFSYFNL